MSEKQAPAIVWFRRDLRLADNEALTAAAESGRPVLACHVPEPGPDAAPRGFDPRRSGGTGRWWLGQSLAALSSGLAKLGGRLVLRSGRPLEALLGLVRETKAREIHCTARSEPEARALECDLRAALAEKGATLHLHRGALLFADADVRTRAGNPYKVFTQFWNACREQPEPGPPLPAPASLRRFDPEIGSASLHDLGLASANAEPAALGDAWVPGEEGALSRLDEFLREGLAGYAQRDRPDRDGTSRLSPHLRFGELGPRQIWHVVRRAAAERTLPEASIDAFLRELGWREFSHYLLRHWPALPGEPMRAQFRDFPWAGDADLFAAWRCGSTGYPIVDAGMRELASRGWMHNRVRMIAASFLVKDLLVPWQSGAAWFLATLVDADLANNSASWQWVAGCGADAAPYFRVFNPVLQGRKLDPDGTYVRRWVPEISRIPTRWVHAPWETPTAVLERLGIDLGRDYPLPIVDHAVARRRALSLYRALKR